MLGALITLLVAKGSVGMGRLLFGRWLKSLDPAAKFGVGGLLGLGALGTLTFFLGLLPGGFQWGIALVGAWGLGGLGYLAVVRKEFKLSKPDGPALVAILALLALSLLALVCVLTPSPIEDWDTLAYHLAVPKQWLAAGHMVYIPSLHQSNFPDVVDGLYVWGLTWGGQAGAKMFSFSFLLLGMVSVFGLTRQRYKGGAGWWAAIAFASVPAVLWESGTAYIDHAHGLFAGLGIVFAALAAEANSDTGEGALLDRSYLWLSAAMLGLATASKYTGLVTLFLVCLVLFAFCAGRKRASEGFKAALLVGLVGLAIGAPWYAKNIIQTGNPVYPFLSSKFPTRDWDQKRAEIYQGEQKKFGVGRGVENVDPLDPTAFGGAVLGLAYQPGRYVNPGETQGMGTPTGAVGMAICAALVLWAVSGRRKKFESVILACTALDLVAWFFLSQQSRYITTLAPPSAILLGGAVACLPLGMLAAGLAALQAGYSAWLFKNQPLFDPRMDVLRGAITPEDFQTKTIPFYAGSQAINQSVAGGKLALYDEVFGFLLDVPYMWANAGHGTMIPYESMNNADDYVREMKKLGFTDAYISLSPVVKNQDFVPKWLASMGMNTGVAPIDQADREAQLQNIEQKWQILFADAVSSGKLTLVQQFRSGMLFHFQ